MKKVILIYVILSLLSCNFSDEVIDLSRGWKFVSESRHVRVIDGGNVHIPCEVLSYAYDENFIIASQKPAKDCFLGEDTFVYKDGRDTIYYWIIVHEKKLLLGPMNDKEFNETKAKYNVPADLELKSAY